jgi:Spy/CpxP family protein refolding chaperone
MKPAVLTTLLMAAAISTGIALAQDQDRTRTQDTTRTQRQTTNQERIYGSQLMTQQERNEYRDRMRAARTEQEREQIRQEHHERILARARERGVTLPEEPPMRGRGMGPSGGGRR